MTEQEFIEHLRYGPCVLRDDGRNLTCLALSNAQSKSGDLVQCIFCSLGFITLFLALLLILNLGYGQGSQYRKNMTGRGKLSL